MKQLFAEITDINNTKHVADLSGLPDAPETAKIAEAVVAKLQWIKVQDGNILNLDHVLMFKIKEVDT